MTKQPMKPSEEFAVRVEPVYLNYIPHLADEHLAGLAASAVNEHLERTFRYYERVDRSRLIASANLGVFRKLLFGRCPSLQMMQDLAEGKHRLLSRPIEANAAQPGEEIELFVVGYYQPFTRALVSAMKFWRAWPD